MPILLQVRLQRGSSMRRLSILIVTVVTLFSQVSPVAVVDVLAAETAPTSCTQAPSVPAPIVKDVYKFGHSDRADPERDHAGINDLIVLHVAGLCTLVDQAKCLGRYAGAGCKT